MKTFKQKVALLLSVLLMVSAIPFTAYADAPSEVECSTDANYVAVVDDYHPAEGQKVVVTITPAEDYSVTGVKYYYQKGTDKSGDATVQPGTNNTQWEFTVPDCDAGHKIIVTPTVTTTKTGASVFYEEFENGHYADYDPDMTHVSGSTVSFKVVPDVDYRVDSIVGEDHNGVKTAFDIAYNAITMEASFTMPAYDVNVVVETKELPTSYANIKTNDPDHGEVKLTYGEYSGSMLSVPVSKTTTPTTIEVEAIADAGYKVEAFKLYDETTGGSTFVEPYDISGSIAIFQIPKAHAYKVVVSFKKNDSTALTYHIYNKVDCTNGTVTMAESAEAGDVVTVVFTPDEGYHLTSASVERSILPGTPYEWIEEPTNTFKFTMPDGDVKVYGKFVKDDVPKHKIYWNYPGQIEVTYDDIPYTAGPIEAEEGAEFVVKLTPAAGEQVKLAQLLDISEKPSKPIGDPVEDHADVVRFTVPKCDSQIYIEFEDAKAYNITVADDILFGTVYTDKQTAKHGDKVLIVASPNTAYYKLKGKPVVTTKDIGDVKVDQASVTEFEFIMPAADVTVDAEFVRNLVGDYYEVKKCVTSFEEHGSIKLAQSEGQVGEVIQFEVVPDDGYKASSISVEATYTDPAEGKEDVEFEYASKLNTYQFEMPACLTTDGDYVTVYAAFEKADEEDHEIFVVERTDGMTNTSHGEVTISPDSPAKQGTKITVEVAAQNGYIVKAISVEGDTTHAKVNTEPSALEGIQNDKAKFVMPDEDVTVTVDYYHSDFMLDVDVAKSIPTSPNTFGTVTIKGLDLSTGHVEDLYFNQLISGSIIPEIGYKIQSAEITYVDAASVSQVIDEIEDMASKYDFEFNFPIGNVKIDVVFAPIEYTVEYDVNGGEGTIDPTTFYYEATASQYLSTTTPTREGYDFVGWNEDEVSTGSTADYLAGAEITTPFTTTEDDVITLHAVWNPHTYTVGYYPGTGTGTVYSQGFVYDVAQDLLANTFTKIGYHFDVWKYASGTDTYTETQNVKNLTSVDGAFYDLEAQWEANDYTVEFNANGGVGATQSEAFTYDAPAKALTTLEALGYSKTGYHFLGWSSDPAATVAAYTDGQTVQNLTTEKDAVVKLYAVWEANDYTVMFYNNNTPVATVSEPYTYDEAPKALTLNTFAKTGYHFLGWSSDPAATTATYTDGQAVQNLTTEKDAVVKMYAVWAPNTYTVEFDANSGSGNMADQAFTYDQAKNLTANTFTKTGYHFSGWATSSVATAAAYDDKESVENLTTVNGATVTLYAVWTPNNYYVVFDANSGDGYMAPQLFTYDVAQTLTPNTYSKPNYSFRGWALAPTDTTSAYTNGQEVINLTAENNGVIKVYARWLAATTGGGGGGGGGGGTVSTTKKTSATYSKFWVQLTDGTWVVQYPSGVTITRTWFCDDAVASNGQNVWYLLGDDGRMITAGLVRDSSGNFYSIETESNGYKGMLRYKDGWYNCNGTMVYIEFEQSHNGAFGAIKNQDAIDILTGIYGVTLYGVSSTNCQYSSTFK